ncbi:TRAPP trafficking subunit Trs65-domain-containing protein [Lactarius akahatsu]|uniref:TRAPP trafficking subunit Trs65-domain-containing protein n=1 Tax=Lactarius akahatsu TaxID=416441 RepID=A0AAD4LM81_9AGAM|nr:TRAPP trafficking subunit Trs65-domain-containing protein [Lactarius akahatsu]
MATFEQIVNSSTLDVVVPNATVKFPTKDTDHGAWLQKLISQETERQRAFFDEFLDFLLVLRLEQPDDVPDPTHPPLTLLSFLTCTQVSYDATYISPAHTPATAQPTPRLGTPPRTVSLKPAPGNGALHVPLSIFPPNTPNPTPVTTEQDRRYVRAEGVTLVSGTWGEASDPAKARLVEDRDAFALLWDETAGVWIAVYRMSINVAFLRLPSHDPLLCLTASITVREKPLPMTPARSALAEMLLAAGGPPKSPASASAEPFTSAQEYDKFYHGLDEVNLLEGLSAAPSFSNAPLPLVLPSTRIGAKTRKQDFALPASPRHSVDLSSTTPTLSTRATLRKSFRRTLPVVSCFRVRMRTVFVPYILFDDTHPDAALDDALAAGHAERTVMLCVELEHPGQAPEGFSVEAVDVTVGGAGGARVRLLPGDGKSPPELFPLRLGAHEQYNLLFAVELLSSPISEKEALLLGMSASALGEELQRPVTITVRGQPFSNSLSQGNDAGARVVGGTEECLFPTQPFPSRWNCVLDLAPQRSPAVGQTDSEVLPEPPTPFPTPTQRISFTPDKQPAPNLVAGSKRFTAPSMPVPRSPRSILALRASTGALGPGAGAIASSSAPSSPSPLSKFAYMPPSVAVALSSGGAPHTTYAPPPSPGIPPPASLNKMLPMAEADEAFVNGGGSTTPPPATPAYPAYPKGSPVPSTPRVQGPLAAWGAASVPGVPVEAPRAGASAALLSRARVQSLPSLPLASASAVPERERVVVSVGMHGGADGGARRLVPHDEFALDVFVFNQSAWTRRFEVSVWERRRRRQGLALGAGAGGGAGPGAGPGIVPLESRVRVGPLRPATCQSVRMSFLALAPGVHTIEALTLTDVETQHALTLRTSMDVVVHETRAPS